MNNREKYKDELIETIKKDGKICGFVKKHNDALQPLGLNNEYFCDEDEIDCYVCAIMLQLWLDEEYEEPEVDWDNVPVDTLVRVRDSESEEWKLRYFSGFFKYDSFKYETWNGGKTSKTASGDHDSTCWKYCELAEDLEEK